MKKILPFLYGMVTSVALFAAFIGVRPTSWGDLYQPEIPEELK
ncbi:hypothetical protein DCCM_3436 [Desulfocucumis palustris]|uniref:Cyclic lactone autoinducer peptide n=1 Tax=Desulfocucumis palustris TaxID=1898651 RepID=A0A2L2XE94_9FIRM|nr:cyclic lactone autoinducer peptide [Desulfocucumis palustris]GBF34324.1 hypothetical protein DCCM_3436 [Desulfocucumis palustris]